MTLSMSSTRAKHRWLLLAAIVAICTLGMSALALATPGTDPTPIPAGYAGFTVQDSGLANDVPGQVDLTQMGRDDATASTYKLFWSWDSISAWTGTGQTGDACALFDTDVPGNTFIDFVVCVRVENFQANPEDVRILSSGGVFAFSCTDKKNDRCTNPTPVPFQPSQIQAGALGGSPLDQTANLITHSDPFATGESFNHDSTVEIHILKSLIGGAAELVNVCSYPSAGNGGNNNPFDCIVSPGGGFLRVVKVADTGAPNFTFSAARGATTLGTFTATGFATNTETATLSGGGTLLPVLVDPNSGANLTVTETNVPSPWALSGVSCVVEDKVPPGTGSPDVTNNRVTAVSIQSGKITMCTFTDQLQTGTLVIKKLVVNDNGGTLEATNFSFSLDAGNTTTAFLTDPDQNPIDPLKGKNSLTLTAGTQFSVTEPAVDGYTTTLDAGCSGTITAGQTSTCTITNDDDAATLIVRKVVINDNGGTLEADDFSFQVNDGTVTDFVTDPEEDPLDPLKGRNTLTVDAGTYTVTEPDVEGYTTTYDNCTNVAIANGASATCTITNDDDAATLIVRKVVINDNGGTLEADDFSFQVNDGTVTDFVTDPEEDPLDPLKGRNTLTVDAGTYTVTEPDVEGYTTTNDNCTNVAIANGASATCTITNHDKKASPTGATTQSWVLHDSLTITGIRPGAVNPAEADATVTFRLYDEAGCDPLTQVGEDEEVSIDGGVAETVDGIAVTATGFYYWTAEYSGDQYNNGFTTVCGDEVTQIQAKDAGRNNLITPI